MLLVGVSRSSIRKEVFNFTLFLFFIYVIIGVAHLHMLLILKKECAIKTAAQVDQYVSARIPPLPPMDDLSDEANQQRRLYHYVTTMMLHECSKACRGHPEDKCRKHFPKSFSSQTEISGFIQLYIVFFHLFNLFI